MPTYRAAKAACYLSGLSMSVLANISPILFLTFHEIFDISYTLLGLLVLVNFCTQLTVDLLYSFFSARLPIALSVRLSPWPAVLGLLIYILGPTLAPQAAYPCLLIGTVLFSVSAGMAEVLTSPVIAAIPSQNPEAEMSRFHSVYAWGTAGVVILSTVFLLIFQRTAWPVLVLLLSLLPLATALCFARAKLPPLSGGENAVGTKGFFRHAGVFLCVGAIFMGGAAECTMSQWASGYLEMALGLPKVAGDVFGVAAFAVMLGLGRVLFASRAKSILPILIFGSFSAAVCYLLASLSPFPILGLVACALTGFCTAMLWPGNLILSSEHYPKAGVALYALMAAGGDLGASVAPQMVGALTDIIAADPGAVSFLFSGGTPEQIGMRFGMLVAAAFPLLGGVILLILRRYFKKKRL